MASISSSTPIPNSGSYGGKGICQIVGYVCLFGFIIDMLILALPPQLGSSEWRLGFVQQFSDRSIILLFGSALILVGSLEKRKLLRQFSTFCLLAGVLFFLLCILAVADSVALQRQAVTTISTQESELQTQIRDAQSNPSAIREDLTAEDLTRASQLLTQQADTLKQNAKTTVFKTAASSVGNLLVMGVGLVGIGRYGLASRRR
ncbi:HpsJ-like protein, cyanoexosortase C-associated [Egbenema bharatensis]|uniref:HpsJ-like protein, cyanoexosortase C-associated n=1 Tax=Egbenema bharatensis TaxID=3463334 RepID=UPI003A8BE061